MVASPDDLVDLPWARDKAMDFWASEKAQRSGTTSLDPDVAVQ